MSSLDLTVIILYFALILSVGFIVVRRQKQNVSNYFLAGRSLGWVVIGSALFASNISTTQIVGLASSGFSDGLVWGNFEWMAIFTLLMLSFIFVPFYFRSKINTLPEFLEKRFDARSRSIMAGIAIITALFVHIGISLYAGAVVFRNFFGIDITVSILIISVLTASYTIVGGLKSVVYTETLQAVILIGGCILLTVMAAMRLPEAMGVGNLQAAVCRLPPAVGKDHFTMLQGSGSPVGLPWYAILLGYPVLGIWYWCADQTIVQRVLGARSIGDAQKGPLFAGFLKILPVFIMVLPGIFAAVILKGQIKDPNDTYPMLINALLPAGLRGLVTAALLAALMSTVAAALNSSATLVSLDIIKRIRPGISEEWQVRAGKIAAAIIMVLAIAWSPFVAKFPSIFQAINQVLSAIAPPVSAVFLLGVLWKRGTAKAAGTTLMAGIALGAVLFLADFPVLGTHKIITEAGVPFMMQAWWLFAFCCGLFVLVSYLSDPPRTEQIRYCFSLKGDSLKISSGTIRTGLILFSIFIGLYILSIIISPQ
jgi:solute:Na+ symporter, SSS family